MSKPKHFSWFKFDWNAWRNDPQLRRCSKETRGFWVDVISVLEEQDAYFLEGTVEELCRDIVCSREEFDRSIAELQRTKAASISKSQGLVKIISRRILKARNLTEYNRLKKQEERERNIVNDVSTAPSKNRVLEEEEKKEEESSNPTLSVDLGPDEPGENLPQPRPKAVGKILPVEIFIGLVTSGLLKRMGLRSFTISDLQDWQKFCRWSFANDFTSEDVLECYDLLKQQDWRDSAVTPKTLSKELPNLSNLRSPKPQSNGAHKPTSEREKSAERTVNTRTAAAALIEEGLRERTGQGLPGDSDVDRLESDQPRQLSGTH